MVLVLLDGLSEGSAIDWILSQDPTLTAESMHGAIASGVWLTWDLTS